MLQDEQQEPNLENRTLKVSLMFQFLLEVELFISEDDYDLSQATAMNFINYPETLLIGEQDKQINNVEVIYPEDESYVNAAIKSDVLMNQLSNLSDKRSVNVAFLEVDAEVVELLASWKHQMRFWDCWNDGVALTMNQLGKMLCLGKVANYSWE